MRKGKKWTDTEDFILKTVKSVEKASILLGRTEKACRQRMLRLKGGVEPLKGWHLCWKCMELVHEEKDKDNLNSASYQGIRLFWHKRCPEGADESKHYKRRMAVGDTV